MKRNHFALEALVLAAAVSTACSSGDQATSERDGQAAASLTTLARPGVLWKRPPGPPEAVNPATASAKLTYRGGAVIANVKVYIVEWGPNVWSQGLSTLQGFFQAVPNSAYFDWLSEYNTQSQSIGRGTYGGTFLDSSPPSGKTIDDTQIQAELKKLISAGKVPAPTANSYYQVVFPPGIAITAGGDTFCKQTAQGTPCAYHDSFALNGAQVRYSPQPDYSGACGSVCGFVSGDNLASLTVTSSHELVEAVTDPDPPNGWYDDLNGEIGDICEGAAQGQNIAGFAVQTEWSNVKKSCIVSNGSGAGGGSGGSGGGGCSCAHDPCTSGAKLAGSCDACAAKVCAADSFCCNSSWDSTCVGEVATICNLQCGTSGVCGTGGGNGGSGGGGGGSGGTGGSTCAHSECSAGAKLKQGCDSCVTQVCAADSFCCGSKWDSQCVSEVASTCGSKTCN